VEVVLAVLIALVAPAVSLLAVWLFDLPWGTSAIAITGVVGMLLAAMFLWEVWRRDAS
jgi:phosphate/sulfate permease